MATARAVRSFGMVLTVALATALAVPGVALAGSAELEVEPDRYDLPWSPPDPFFAVPGPEPEPIHGSWIWTPGSDQIVRYQPPVVGAVIRGFEPPSTDFGAGHRGVDLALAPFERVEAAANGVVHHAGPVGRTVWVSLAHDDGVITSYGPLTRLEVSKGDRVRRGTRLGVLAPGGHGEGNVDHGLHWGARRGMSYFDPLTLLDAGLPRPSLVGAGAWRGTEHRVTPYEPWEGNRFAGLGLSPSPQVSAPGYSVPPSPNHLVMVGGLASSSNAPPLDPRNLGYSSSSVTHLSYAGRHDSGAGLDPDDPRRDQVPYGPSYTWAGVEWAAQRLAEQLRAQREREPGRAVDLVGHSMGGVVIVYYLTHLHDPYDPTLPSIGRVVTIGAPHQGSDLASSARYVREHLVAGPAVDLLSRWIPAGAGSSVREVLPLHAPAIDELAVDSRLLRDQSKGWVDALAQGPAGPLAMGTEVLTIAGSTDLVVAPSRSSLDLPADQLLDAESSFASEDVVVHRTLPGSHDRVRTTEATTETIYRFLAGEPTQYARPGLGAAAADELGVVMHVGALALYVTGALGTGIRRLRRSPGAGPTERSDDQRDLMERHGGQPWREPEEPPAAP